MARPTSFIKKFSVRSTFAFLELNTLATVSPLYFCNLTAVTITLVFYIVSLNFTVPQYLDNTFSIPLASYLDLLMIFHTPLFESSNIVLPSSVNSFIKPSLSTNGL